MHLNNNFYLGDFGKYADETTARDEDEPHSNSSKSIDMEVFANVNDSQLEPLNSFATEQLIRRIALRQQVNTKNTIYIIIEIIIIIIVLYFSRK